MADAGVPAILLGAFNLGMSEETTYLVLQVVGGQVLLPLLLLTVFLSKTISRTAVFINFCLSWIISSVAFSLVLYTQRLIPETLALNPSANLCLIQASMINGAQAMTSCANLALVLHLWNILRCFQASKVGGNQKLWGFYPNVALIMTPLVAFIVFTAVTAVYGNQPMLGVGNEFIPGTNIAVPSLFYCFILDNSTDITSLAPHLRLFRAVYAFCALTSVITLLFEIQVLVEVFKRHSALRKWARSGSMPLFFRVAAFSLYRIVSLSLTVALIVQPEQIIVEGLSKTPLFNGAIDLVQAALPLVAFLVLGTQKDVLRIWFSWIKIPGWKGSSSKDNRVRIVVDKVEELESVGDEKEKESVGDMVDP